MDKMWLERFLGMGSGYVLNFSNRTFKEFILEHTGLDIDDDKYTYGSGSKANRLRAFWAKESNYTTSKLLHGLLEYYRAHSEMGVYDIDSVEAEFKHCSEIAGRLSNDALVENVDSIQPRTLDKDFESLSKAVRDAIQKNEPQQALDRLHTYMVRFVRSLCDAHEIQFSQDDSLNAIFGKYVKFLNQQQLMETTMGEKILKASISILDAFNQVRNEKSFAHGNRLLNYDESLLIFNNIANTVRFIDSLESQLNAANETAMAPVDDLPF